MICKTKYVNMPRTALRHKLQAARVQALDKSREEIILTHQHPTIPLLCLPFIMFIQSARRSAIRRTGRLSHSTAASPTSPSSRCAAFDKRPSATKSVVVRGLLRSSGRVLGGAAGGNNDIGPYWEVDGSLGGVVGRVSPGNPSTMGEFPHVRIRDYVLFHDSMFH